jgi:hypothetical protein
MIEQIENPRALTGLFGEGFDISEVDLHEVSIHRDGPTLQFRFDISRVPASHPARWPAGANTTQVVLRAGGIDRLQITGFSTRCGGILRTLTVGGTPVIEFTSESCSVTCSFSWLRVESVSGYVNT